MVRAYLSLSLYIYIFVNNTFICLILCVISLMVSVDVKHHVYLLTFICLGGVSRCLVRFNGFPIFRKEGGDPSAIKDPVVTGIASRKGKSPAQVR